MKTPRLTSLFLCALIFLGVTGCASSKKEVVTELPKEKGEESESQLSGGREDSLLLARSLFLLALDLENQGIEFGVDHLVSRAFLYDPRDRWLGFKTLEALVGAGRYDEAQNLLTQVASIPGDSTVSQFLLLAQLWRQKGQLDSALVAIQQGEAIDDENVRLLFEKVLVLERLGRHKEMSQVHTRLIRFLDYPNELIWKQVYLNTILKDTTAQEELYRELRKNQGGSWGYELLQLQIANRKFEEAADVAQELLDRAPQDEELQNILVTLLQKSNQDSVAVVRFHSFYQDDTSRIDMLDYAGRLEVKMGRSKEGIAHLLKVIEVKPQSAHTLFFLSMGYAQEGETDNALEAIERALKIDSIDAALHTQRVLVLMSGSRFSQATQALDDWKAATADTATLPEIRATVWTTEAFHLEERLGDKPRADSLRRLALPILFKMSEEREVRIGRLFDLATTLERLDRFEEAKPYFERILAFDPFNAGALNYYGYSLMVRGEQLQRADTLVTRALAVEPNNEAYIDSKAWSLHLQGRHQEALELLDALEQNGKLNHGEMCEHKALILEALGRNSEALSYWKRVVELYPAYAKRIKSLPEELKEQTLSGEENVEEEREVTPPAAETKKAPKK